MASYDWRLEMENMLAAFNRQAIHSLSIISLAFKEGNLSFTQEFKKHFVQASTNRISEAYDQFQINEMVEKKLSPSLNSFANVSRRSPRNGTNGVECETDDRENGTSVGDENVWLTNASDSVIQIDDLDYDAIVIEAVEAETTDDKTAVENDTTSNASPNEIKNNTIVTRSTSDAHNSNDSPVSIDDLHEHNELIDLQLSTNNFYIVAPDVGSESSFAVEMSESNDLIEMIENQNDSTDVDDDELDTVHVVLDHLNETTISEWVEDKSKTTRLNRKNPHIKRMMKTEDANGDRNSFTTKGGKPASKQLTSRSKKRCTICGYAGSQVSRHMRTHTGERPHQCNRCGKSFTNAANLMKHVATHIAEFPFHCRACFQGFSLKAEAIDHENHCQKFHYECHLCKKLLTFDKTELVRHMRKHNGIKPFRCEICTKHFVQKENLKRHLNTIHSRINH